MKVILYTKNFNHTVTEPVNIILSPEFYWIKKIDAPIKTISEAKKIAKNMFKLDSEIYFFDAVKMDNLFYVIALKKRLELQIDEKFIQNIYLAQELIVFENIEIDSDSILTNVNGIMFILPKKGKSGVRKFSEIVDKIKLKNKISLFSEKIDNTFVVPIFIFLFSINFYFIQTIYNNNRIINSLTEKKYALLKENSLPSTSYQLKSIVSRLENTNINQIKIRKKLEFISKVAPRKLLKLSLNRNVFKIEIESDKNLDYLFKKEFSINSILRNKIYKAELSYE